MDQVVNSGRTGSELRVAASPALPSPNALKIFVSYSRRDLAAADAMVAALEGHGFAVTIDRRDLPYGEEWQTELAGFIAASDTVVWLVSPDSVKSKWVNWELGEVGRLSKRLIPVKVRETPPEELPEALGRIHLLPAEGEYDPTRHEADLVTALNTDRAWLRMHTLMAEDATAWVTSERDAAHLLRGRRLSEAEAWSIRKPASAPTPTNATMELLLASRAAQRRGQRITVAGSITAAIVAIGLAATAVWFGFEARNQATEANSQRQVADGQRRLAVAQQSEAERQKATAIANESVGLAALSGVALSKGYSTDAVKLALAAWPRIGSEDRPASRRTLEALGAALPAMHQRLSIRMDGTALKQPGFSSDGKFILTIAGATARLWDARSGAETASFDTGDEEALGAILSPDGRLVFVGSKTSATLWDTATGKLLRRLDSGGAPVRFLRFSPDGALVAGVVSANEVRVWRTGDGTEVAAVESRTTRTISFSADGRLLGIGSRYGAATTLDIATGRVVVQQPAETIDLPEFRHAFSPDGRRFVIAGRGGIAVRDSLTGDTVATLTGHAEGVNGSISDVAFSGDGSRVATASGDRTARIWDASTGANVAVLTQPAMVQTVSFSGDGSRIITTALEGSIRVWDASTGSEVVVLTGHHQSAISAALSADGAYAVTASRDGTVAVWQVDTMRAVVTSGEDNAMYLAGDGRRIVAASAPAWHASGIAFPEIANRADLAGAAVAAVSRDGRTIATYDGDEGRRLAIRQEGMSVKVEIVGHTDAVRDAAFSPDGTMVATGSNDFTAALWDARTGHELHRFRDHTGYVSDVAFSPDGTRVATASHDRTARLYDTASGALLATLRGHTDDLNSVDFSPDGGTVVTASSDRTVRTWNARTGDQIALLEPGGTIEQAGGARASINPLTGRPVAIDPRSSIERAEFVGKSNYLLAMASVARVIDASTGRQLFEMRPPKWQISAAAASDDGLRVMTVDGENTVRIWDMASGIEVASTVVLVRRGSPELRFVDGSRFAMTTGDLGSTLWDLSPAGEGDAFKIACERLGNNTSLEDIQERYGLGKLAPICGDAAPLPVDWETLD